MLQTNRRKFPCGGASLWRSCFGDLGFAFDGWYANRNDAEQVAAHVVEDLNLRATVLEKKRQWWSDPQPLIHHFVRLVTERRRKSLFSRIDSDLSIYWVEEELSLYKQNWRDRFAKEQKFLKKLKNGFGIDTDADEECFRQEVERQISLLLPKLPRPPSPSCRPHYTWKEMYP
jgi:hypothetical protein